MSRAQWGQPLTWQVPGWQDKNLHSWPKAILPLGHPSLPESWWHSGHRRRGAYLVLSARKKLLAWEPMSSHDNAGPGWAAMITVHEDSPEVTQGPCPAPALPASLRAEPQAQEEPTWGTETYHLSPSPPPTTRKMLELL